jgi:hypothetical protein
MPKKGLRSGANSDSCLRCGRRVGDDGRQDRDQRQLWRGAAAFKPGVGRIERHTGAAPALQPTTRAWCGIVAFRSLGYRTSILRDDDAQPLKLLENMFVRRGGLIFKWRDGRALEDELFACLPDVAVTTLLEHAVEIYGEELIDAHIKSASGNKLTLIGCRAKPTADIRTCLAKACATKHNPWFKSVSAMEFCGREIVGPALAKSETGFRTIIESVFAWIDDARA